MYQPGLWAKMKYGFAKLSRLLIIIVIPLLLCTIFFIPFAIVINVLANGLVFPVFSDYFITEASEVIGVIWVFLAYACFYFFLLLKYLNAKDNIGFSRHLYSIIQFITLLGAIIILIQFFSSPNIFIFCLLLLQCFLLLISIYLLLHRKSNILSASANSSFRRSLIGTPLRLSKVEDLSDKDKMLRGRRW